jgi:hypothetical protein
MDGTRVRGGKVSDNKEIRKKIRSAKDAEREHPPLTRLRSKQVEGTARELLAHAAEEFKKLSPEAQAQERQGILEAMGIPAPPSTGPPAAPVVVYFLHAKCKTQEPKPCPAWIRLDNIRGFSLSGNSLSYQGPPIYLHCATCGETHNYTLIDVRLRQTSDHPES